MALFQSVKKAFTKTPPAGNPAAGEAAPAAPESPAPQPAPLVVPEIETAELLEQFRSGAELHLLDCREPFEWAQVRIPGSLHIPMNEIPARLGELDADAEWVVVCAHGNRSYSVAGYLLHNGLQASSLAGGVTDWWMRGGETESDYRR